MWHERQGVTAAYWQGCVSVESCGQGEGKPRALKFECPNILCLVGMVIQSVARLFIREGGFFALKGSSNRPLEGWGMRREGSGLVLVLDFC